MINAILDITTNLTSTLELSVAPSLRASNSNAVDPFSGVMGI